MELQLSHFLLWHSDHPAYLIYYYFDKKYLKMCHQEVLLLINVWLYVSNSEFFFYFYCQISPCITDLWWRGLYNSWAMTHAMQDYTRWISHRKEFWANMVHWRRNWQHTIVFMPGERHELYEKAKIYDKTPEDESSKLQGIWYATGEEWRAITNNSIKKEASGQSRKDSLLWMCKEK